MDLRRGSLKHKKIGRNVMRVNKVRICASSKKVMRTGRTLRGMCLLVELASFFVIFFSLKMNMQAQEPFPNFRNMPDGHVSIKGNKFFVHPERTLRYYIKGTHWQNQVNHFCMVGYHFPAVPAEEIPEDLQAYVFWQEGNRLLLYEGIEQDDPESQDDLYWKSAISNEWNWNQDTRNEDAYLGNHAVTKAWWTSVVRDCWKHGEFYTIQPLAKSKSSRPLAAHR